MKAIAPQEPPEGWGRDADYDLVVIGTGGAAAAGGIAAENALTGNSRRLDLTVLPEVIFTGSQVATVGFTEAQARTSGYDDVKATVLPLAYVPRALAAREHARPDQAGSRRRHGAAAGRAHPGRRRGRGRAGSHPGYQVRLDAGRSDRHPVPLPDPSRGVEAGGADL